MACAGLLRIIIAIGCQPCSPDVLHETVTASNFVFSANSELELNSGHGNSLLVGGHACVQIQADVVMSVADFLGCCCRVRGWRERRSPGLWNKAEAVVAGVLLGNRKGHVSPLADMTVDSSPQHSGQMLKWYSAGRRSTTQAKAAAGGRKGVPRQP